MTVEKKKTSYSWSIIFLATWLVLATPLIGELPLIVLGLAFLMWPLQMFLNKFKNKTSKIFWIVARMIFLFIAVTASVMHLQQGFRLNDAMNFFIFLPAIKNMEMSETRDRGMQILILALFWTGTLLLCESMALMFFSCFVLLWFLLMLSMAHLSAWQFSQRAFKCSITVTLLSLPLTAMFFLLFPRIHFFGRIYWPEGKSGMSASMRPGELSRILLDESVFASVLHGNKINPGWKTPLYWRFAVLNRPNGMHWLRSQTKSKVSSKILKPEEMADTSWSLESASNDPKPLVDYDVYFREMGEGVLLSLEGTDDLRPLNRMSIQKKRDGSFDAVYFQGQHPYYRGSWRNHLFDDRPTLQDLEIGGLPSQEFKALISEIKSKPEPLLGLRQFLEKSFVYTLEPGTYSGLDEFLFQRKRGYCEHYAGATATILRSLGIPARVVVGFVTQDFNDDSMLEILNMDAHAWVEYWHKKNAHWVRLDPTRWIAPARFNQSALAWRASLGLAQASVWRQWFQTATNVKFTRWLQSLYLKSNLWFLHFDRDEQRKLWRFNPEYTYLWKVIGVLAGLFLLLWFIVGREKLVRHPLERQWAKFIRQKLPQIGADQRSDAQLCNQTAQKLLSNTAEFEDIVRYYCHLRYGPPGREKDHSILLEKMRRFEPQSRPPE